MNDFQKSAKLQEPGEQPDPYPVTDPANEPPTDPFPTPAEPFIVPTEPLPNPEPVSDAPPVPDNPLPLPEPLPN